MHSMRERPGPIDHELRSQAPALAMDHSLLRKAASLRCDQSYRIVYYCCGLYPYSRCKAADPKLSSLAIMVPCEILTRGERSHTKEEDGVYAPARATRAPHADFSVFRLSFPLILREYSLMSLFSTQGICRGFLAPLLENKMVGFVMWGTSFYIVPQNH
jgi:hypothetical protein